MPTTAFEGFKSGNTIIPVKDVNALPRSEQVVLGAKNLLPPVKSAFIPDLTFTANADGSVDIVGSTTVSAVYNIVTALTNTPALILSGANGGSANTTYLEAVIRPLGGGSPIEVIDDVGNGASIRALASNEQMDIRIGYKADVTLNAKFYPMLRLASDPDDTYVPYAMTNKELTENNAVKTLTIEPATGITINDVSYAKIRNGILNAYISFKNETNDITAFTNTLTIKGITGLKDYQMSLVGIDTTTNQPVACYCPYTKSVSSINIQTRVNVTANHNVVLMITAILE